MNPEQDSARRLWRWAGIMAFPFLAIVLSFGRIAGIGDCAVAADPIFAFEMVTTPQEVAAQFPDSCRAAASAGQRSGLWLDILAFVAVYSSLLILVLAALAREGAAPLRLAKLAAGLVIVAAMADQWENSRLLAILAAMPGDQATIDQLIPAVRIKFGLLAVVQVAIGWFHLGQAGWRKLAGLVIAGGGLLSLAGLAVNHHWVLPGGSIAFLAIVLSSWALALRRKPA